MELKKYRRIAGLTQQQLAKKAGVHKSVISRLESGERSTASYESVVRIARVLNLKPEELIPVPETDTPDIEPTNRRDGERRAS
jgi:transcriptional regulator with XRE-family HTH domain